jgi:DNA modification methylase/transcriptional regulator with XRE-family HTH domain
VSATFLDGRVTLHAGDCREVLRDLPTASIDSVVTDPPYALVSIGKRFGKPGAAPAQHGKDGLYARASAGFMHQEWDTGETAFAVEFWAEVLRVLKPGGHVVAFSGTRTYHRMVCAIEDAGFEIRDQVKFDHEADVERIAFLNSLTDEQRAQFMKLFAEADELGQLAWVYGSGFPKSHDVAKGIDKRGGVQVAWFGPWLKAWREKNGIKQSEVATLFPSKTGGKTGCVANWELGLNMPTPEQFNLICSTFRLPFASLEEAERQIVGIGAKPKPTFHTADIGGDAIGNTYDITAPATDAAREWQGWGTALKPAWEPICLARKPLIGTVAENVLQHGTGALNIDGCRVEADTSEMEGRSGKSTPNNVWGKGVGHDTMWSPDNKGRWPANIVHDGSDEVVACFPETASGSGQRGGTSPNPMSWGNGRPSVSFDGDSGSAARFFYSAKADSNDRLGSKHPTVKPIDLMQWLVRLVTPPGGLVLDPFAGTGTTGEAAWREGMRAVLIEREAQFQADIAKRMELCLAGPATRRAAIGAAKAERAEALPLFAAE